MERVPKNSIPSMAQKMMGMRIADKSEKALMVRIGVLIDAIVEAQRGHNNAGAVNRRQNVNNLKKPQLLTGTAENVFNGAQISINASSSSANLSHYEAEISDNEQFSDPTRKEIFTTVTTFKGLVENQTYHVRIRPVTKDGQIGDWAALQQVLTTPNGAIAEFDGTILTESRVSQTFTFDSASEEMFTVACVPKFDAFPGSSVDSTAIRVARGESAVYTVMETITYPGQDCSTTGMTGSGSTSVDIKKGQALAFFNLIPPDTTSFPVDHTFKVEISESGAAFTTTSDPVVWVKF